MHLAVGLNDGTTERLRHWAETDDRIRLIEVTSNLGPFQSSETIARAAIAPIVARMDADDVSWPDRLSQQWRRTAASLGLPQVTFHAFRHTHASALIAAGLDILTISRRLGHGSPGITLGIYAHLFSNTDATAAKAMDAALGSR